MTSIYPSARARRKAIVGWSLFDFANSAYTTLIITVAYSVYFRDVVVAAVDNSGDRAWGIANFVAMLTVAVSSPILGALADYSGRKKLFLILTTLLTIGATAGMYWVGPGDVWLGTILFIVATFGFESGYVFYNSFLPEISTPKTIGRISGWGWGIGFVGGLSALVLCYRWISSELFDAETGQLVDEAVSDRQFSFLLVAVFYLVFALPAFRWLRETRRLALPSHGGNYLRIGWRRVRQTLSQLWRHQETGKFILSSLFFNDGITTVISFSAIYATSTFGLSPSELVILFLVLNVVAFPSAVAAGYLADRWGGKRTLILTLILWIGVVIVGALAWNVTMFWVMACGAAVGMGSTQSVARSFMAQITPAEREAEFFGFYVLSGKFASLFGPLIFGLVSSATGSQRIAVATLLPLFLIGVWILVTIDERKAIQSAGRESIQPGL